MVTKKEKNHYDSKKKLKLMENNLPKETGWKWGKSRF